MHDLTTTSHDDRDATREAPGLLVETGQRLGDSVLWDWQRAFFEEHGLGAFAEGIVPHYITSNAFIAERYARLVFAWLRDVAPNVDRTRPLPIVELGAGAGRFAFLFLQHFVPMLERSSLAALPVRYVITDAVEGNVARLAAHPRFAPFVASGRLLFARCDAERDATCALLDGSPLPLEHNPLALIANYVFDGLRQDVFCIDAGAIEDCPVTVGFTASPGGPPSPAWLPLAQLTYARRPLAGPAYPEPELSRLLDRYRDFEGPAYVNFPREALRCLTRLCAQNPRVLLIAGDKGDARGEDALRDRPPAPVAHGSISLDVNFDAIAGWFEQRGGQALHTRFRDAGFVVGAYTLGPEPTGELALAYEQAIERFGPDDFFTLKKRLEQSFAVLSLEEILAVVRLAGWDATIFIACADTLIAELAVAGAIAREEVRQLVHRIWELYFPIGEATDVACACAIVLYRAGYYEDCLSLFAESRRLYGASAAGACYEAMAHHALGADTAARARVDEALQIDPHNDAALALRHTLLAAPV